MTDTTAVMQKLTDLQNYTKSIMSPLDPESYTYSYLDGARQGLAHAFSLLKAKAEGSSNG